MDLAVAHSGLDQQEAGLTLDADLEVPGEAAEQTNPHLPQGLVVPIAIGPATQLERRPNRVVWTAPVRTDQHEDTAWGEHAIEFVQHRVDVQDMLEDVRDVTTFTLASRNGTRRPS